MTASQKAIGVPPGLALMVVSKRALQVSADRKAAPTTYFGSFKKWLPIMQKYEARLPSYFATPPVQLILALEVSLKQFLVKGMDDRFAAHVAASNKFKSACARLGLRLVRFSSLFTSLIPNNRYLKLKMLRHIHCLLFIIPKESLVENY